MQLLAEQRQFAYAVGFAERCKSGGFNGQAFHAEDYVPKRAVRARMVVPTSTTTKVELIGHQLHDPVPTAAGVAGSGLSPVSLTPKKNVSLQWNLNGRIDLRKAT
jgi:hypothetical protein